MVLLWLIFCFIIFRSNAQLSPLGTEQTLRREIDELNKGKLQFSKDHLLFAKDELSDTTPKNHSEYDYIVIGAGTAGSTIASRLTEIENVTVLLIEAGGKEYSIMDIPSLAIPLQYSREVNWCYKTERSDKYCLAMKNQQCRWPRGKVMGGSSTINYMLATRGNRRDYDEWANITEDESWSYNNMLKYLKKLENFDGRNIPVESQFHNENGPLDVSGPSRRVELTNAFLRAGEELHYSEIDYNGYEQIGFSYYQSVIKEGERWSNNRAYLRPAKYRNNLISTQHSHVHKVLIDEKSRKACGVRYSKRNKIYEVEARKEIIVCAGAVNSPQILMLSGIGPSKHLYDMNIDIVQDSPVGENLIDHIGYAGLAFKTNISTDDLSLTDPKNPAIKNYLETRSGPLSVGLSLGGIAYVNVDEANNLQSNIEILLNLNGGLKDPLFAAALGINDEYRKQLAADKPESSVYMLWPMITKPYSRGKLLLRSNNPYDKPIIYPNYLKDRRDVEVMIKGIRFAIKLSKTTAMQKIGSQMYDVPLPCKNYEDDSDEYWECAARAYTGTIYHHVGTCKMGREDDPTSVVDPQLKVIGIRGLRVVDASVMPDISSGHTNIPTTAIAEKAADMIKEEHDL